MTTLATNTHALIHALAINIKLAFREGHAAGIANFYSDDGMLLPTGFDFIQGRQDIETFWQGAINMGIRDFDLDIIELDQHGDTIIEISRYTLSDENDQVMDHGKGIVIWKREAGSWKIHRDIWNSSTAQT